jgi:hypothetical protein
MSGGSVLRAGRKVMCVGSIGIFWLMPRQGGRSTILAHRPSMSEAEEYGDCLTDPLSHYDAWETTKRGHPVLAPVDAAIK